MKNAEEYAAIIMNDEREKIVKETPTIYNDDQIERLYEFADGAVIKYEWQSTPDGRTSAEEKFNHKFSLIKTPNPNPHKLKEGIVKQTNYPKS